MPYEINKDRYHDMDKGRTLGIISACDIEIPILKEDYDYIINDSKFKNEVEYVEKNISNIFSESSYKDKFKKKLHLSVLPDFCTNNYFLGYSPKEIVKTIYELLDINYSVDITYSNPIALQLSKNVVMETLNNKIVELSNKLKSLRDEYKTCDNNYLFMQLNKEYKELDSKIDFTIEALNKMDYIFNLYNYRSINNYSTNRIIKEEGKERKELDYHIKWRNLSQYIAINSLIEYEKTNNNLYLEYPYKFYERCSKPDENGKQMLYVDELFLELEYLDPKFYNFNSRCENIFNKSPLRIEFLLHYKDNNKITVFETLNPSEMLLDDEDFGDFITHKANKSRVGNPSKERLKADKQLASKIKFYAYNSEFSDHVVSRLYLNENNETGYVGFILENDYIVLDKFFKESLDGKCIPAKDSAIYALPLDLYIKLNKNSGNIRSYKKSHPKCNEILHKYHTDKETYQTALLELADRNSVSSIKADDYVRINGGRISTITKTKKKVKKPKNKKD